MSYFDVIEERQRARFFAEIRRRQLTLLAVGAAVLLLMASIILIVSKGIFSPPPPQPPSPSDSIALSFGLDRDPVTRSFTTDVTGAQPDEADSGDSISVRLRSDLRNTATSSEFPSSQVTIGVTRLAGSRINLTVTANPWEPEAVHAGLYTGYIDIVGSGLTGSVPMQVHLASRDHPLPVVIALLLLVGGATLGLLVKWITESLTPRAASMRRLAHLKRSIGYGDDGASLPMSVRMDVDDLLDFVERQNYAEAEERFTKLAKDRPKLSLVSSRLQALQNMLAQQSRILRDRHSITEDDALLLNGVVDTEYRRLLDLQARVWPDEEDYILNESDSCKRDFAVVRSAIEGFLRRQSDDKRRALRVLQEGDFSNGTAAVRTAEDSPGPLDDGATATGTGVMYPESFYRSSILLGRRKDGSGDLSWAFRNAIRIAALSSILVVSLVGLKTQYIDDQSFDGALGSWVTLGLWAVVVELSGLSVLDVVGRLGGSAAGTASASNGRG